MFGTRNIAFPPSPSAVKVGLYVLRGEQVILVNKKMILFSKAESVGSPGLPMKQNNVLVQKLQANKTQK
jgi:hypothetical protein